MFNGGLLKNALTKNKLRTVLNGNRYLSGGLKNAENDINQAA